MPREQQQKGVHSPHVHQISMHTGVAYREMQVLIATTTLLGGIMTTEAGK